MPLFSDFFVFWKPCPIGVPLDEQVRTANSNSGLVSHKVIFLESRFWSLPGKLDVIKGSRAAWERDNCGQNPRTFLAEYWLYWECWDKANLFAEDKLPMLRQMVRKWARTEAVESEYRPLLMIDDTKPLTREGVIAAFDFLEEWTKRKNAELDATQSHDAPISPHPEENRKTK
jgi:hypothetical protein